MKISAEASHKIENMSLLCAILVVTIHVGWSSQAGSIGWYIREIVKGGIAGIAVPFFFVVSGFFLSAHFSEKGWWFRETSKRISTLLVPFFLWVILSIVSGWPLGIIADLIAHRPFGSNLYLGLDSPLRVFGLDLSYYPHLSPLWFVRSLFVFVIISPVIKWCVERFSYVWLAAAFACSMAISTGFAVFYYGVETGCPLSYLTVGISINGVFYFSLGMLIRRKKWHCTDRKWAVGCLLFAGELKAFCLALSYNGIVSFFPIPYVPFALYGIWHFIPVRSLPPSLRGCSFPIFLMHMIVFDSLASHRRKIAQA